MYFQNKYNLYGPQDNYGQGYLGADTSYDASTPMASQAVQGEGMGAAAAPAAAGSSLAGPAAAIGGQFLISYLQARAAEERQKRDLAMRNQADYAQNQNRGMDTLLNAWTRSLK